MEGSSLFSRPSPGTNEARAQSADTAREGFGPLFQSREVGRGAATDRKPAGKTRVNLPGTVVTVSRLFAPGRVSLFPVNVTPGEKIRDKAGNLSVIQSVDKKAGTVRVQIQDERGATMGWATVPVAQWAQERNAAWR